MSSAALLLVLDAEPLALDVVALRERRRRGLACPGLPSTSFVIGNRICSRTTWMKVSLVIPSSRACANASSRFGPDRAVRPCVGERVAPAAGLEEERLAGCLVAAREYPPVPQPASANAAAAAAQLPTTRSQR